MFRLITGHHQVSSYKLCCKGVIQLLQTLIRFYLKSYAVRVLYYYCKRLSGFILKVML